MRIAFVTETWHPSTDGVVTRLTATVRELRRRGHQLLVVAPRGAEPSFEGIPVRTVPTVSIGFIAGGRPWGLPVPQVGTYLKAFGPDVVHVVNPFVVGVAGVYYARRHGWPLVASYHTNVATYASYYHLGFTRPAIWALLRALHNQADVNLVTSQAVKRDVEAHGIRRVALWERGVDTQSFHPRRRSPQGRARLGLTLPQAPVVLYVGRLAPEKGLERLRALFGPDRLPVNLVLVGDGPLRGELEAYFQGTPTRFLGMRWGEELAEVYANADLFVFPSTTDTLGLVVLEAMASGLPVVAADSPPSHEMLDAAQAGVFFRPQDPQDLARQVEALLSPQGAARLAMLRENARREAERHDWSYATEGLLRWYAQAMKLRFQRVQV